MKKQKRNSLTIRTTGEQELHFHYDREDRLSMPGAPQKAESSGFFRKYRILVIILLDIIILGILAVIFTRFLPGATYESSLSGYSVVLRGLPYEDAVFATIVVKRITKKISDREMNRIYVRFFLSDKKLKKNERVLSGVEYAQSAALPIDMGDEIMLREALSIGENAEWLYAEVTIGDEVKLLFRHLD